MTSKYIRLSKYLINTDYIRKIEIKPKSFHIDLYDSSSSYGFLLHGTGFLFNSQTTTINVFSDLNKSDSDQSDSADQNDYKIIKNWIDKYGFIGN